MRLSLDGLKVLDAIDRKGPFAGAAAGVNHGGGTADAFVVDPAMINRATIGGFHGPGGTEAVEEWCLLHPVALDA